MIWMLTTETLLPMGLNGESKDMKIRYSFVFLSKMRKGGDFIGFYFFNNVGSFNSLISTGLHCAEDGHINSVSKQTHSASVSHTV